MILGPNCDKADVLIQSTFCNFNFYLTYIIRFFIMENYCQASSNCTLSLDSMHTQPTFDVVCKVLKHIIYYIYICPLKLLEL
jgi:hypothetical protein